MRRAVESRGYKVLRIWNNEVTNDIEAVIRVILYALDEIE